MNTWYRVTKMKRYSADKIWDSSYILRPFSVISETPKMIKVNLGYGDNPVRSFKKETKFKIFLPSMEEALKFLINHYDHDMNFIETFKQFWPEYKEKIDDLSSM